MKKQNKKCAEGEFKPTREELSDLRRTKIFKKEIKAIENNPTFLIDKALLKIAPDFYGDNIKKDPKKLRAAYILYFEAILKILEKSSEFEYMSLPLTQHIIHLKELQTGNGPDYLKNEKICRKPVKSRELMHKEQFVAAAVNILREENFSKNDAIAKVSIWCDKDKINLGGRSSTKSRVKRIYEEISHDSLQDKKYKCICGSWQALGETREKAAFCMIRTLKFTSL